LRKRLWDLNMIHIPPTKHIVHIIPTKCKCSFWTYLILKHFQMITYSLEIDENYCILPLRTQNRMEERCELQFL